MMMQVKGIEDSQLVNSYSSQKVDSERHLLNPLYLQNQQQLANSNPLPYTSVVTPPSTAGADSQIHDYATLDNFQPTVPQWPPQQPREYSDPTPPLNGEVAYYASSSGEAAAAYSEPLTQNGGYKVGEDGIVTDLQGYASLDPTAHHSYDYPQVNGEARVGTEGLSTLSIPQPYETPLESSYEDASSTNMSRSSTPLSARRESPKRREMDPVSNYTSLKGEEKSSPYAEHSPVPDVDQLSSPGRTVSSPTHDYATLEPPK